MVRSDIDTIDSRDLDLYLDLDSDSANLTASLKTVHSCLGSNPWSWAITMLNFPL